MSTHRKKLVIGIDYGTTNSGVAYAVVTDPKNDSVKIEVIREWPHGSLAENIPSDIAYNESGEPIGYGFDIPEDAQPVQWVKLLLEPSELGEKRPGTERIWQSMGVLDKIRKHPIDAVADYLRWLWSEVEKSLEASGDDLDTDETIVVITLPASWSDRAKNSMLQAAQKAGIDNGRTLKFRAEPEAAAMCELKTRAKKEQIAVGDCFIVCDAGGGTVDVVSFQVLSLEPLSLNQVVVSEGEFCGSSFVNAEFEAQLRSFLGSDFDKLDSQTKARVREEFEQTIKRKFSPERRTDYTIPVTGLEDNEEKGIKHGKLKLKGAILNRSFEEIMTQTLMLIDGQKAGLKTKNLLNKLKAILLVGGFGGSQYLHARISQEYPKSEHVRVWRGDHSWTAVVQGAVQCEVANREMYAPFNTRLSRYHYGIPYRRGDLKKVQWLIHKGQDVRDSSHIESYLLRMEERDWLDKEEFAIIRVQLVKSHQDQVTEDHDSSLEPHVEINCKVPTRIRHSAEATLIQENPRVWRIPAELILAMDGPLLTVRCRIQGKDVGLLDLKYHDDDDFPSHGLSAVQTMVEPDRQTESEEHEDGVQRKESTAAKETGPWTLLTRSSQSSRITKGAADSVMSNYPTSPPEHTTTPPRQASEELVSPPSNSSTSLPSQSMSDSRSNSTSPRPKISLPFFRRGSKSEEEKVEEALRKEQKARREEERKLEKKRLAEEEEAQRKREGKSRERQKNSDLWIPFTNKNGDEMLRNRLTGEVARGAPKQAEGYGLH
jgi:hypothetical protein